MYHRRFTGVAAAAAAAAALSLLSPFCHYHTFGTRLESVPESTIL
jgi:hypothetical protein